MKIEIDDNDLVSICVLLEGVLQAHEQDERAALDNMTLDKPLSDIERLCYHLKANSLLDVRDLFERLREKIPEHRL